MTTESLLEFGLLATVLSSIWILFVLAIRMAVARWLGARWAYYLWLVPLLGLLAMAVPSQPVQRMLDLPGIEVPVVNRMIDSASSVLDYMDTPDHPGTLQNPAARQHGTGELLFIVWMLGALFSLLYFTYGSYRYSTTAYRSSRPVTGRQASLVRSVCNKLTARRSVPVRMTPSGRGPAVIGLLRPVLYLPADFFQRFSPGQQGLILEHEYQHLRRHDLTGLLLARIYRCVFWFNPLVYVAERYLQLDQEISVDEKVLANRDRVTRRIYGETLLLSAHAGFSVAQVNYSSTFGQFKQRARLLRHYRCTVLGSMLGGLLLIMASGVSVTYGVLGVAEIAPDLETRETLRAPLTSALRELESGTLGHAELTTMLAGLQSLEKAFPGRPLSDNELAQLNDLEALVYYDLGEFDQAIESYQAVVSLTGRVPEHRAKALNSIARIHFARANYVETIKALVSSEDADPSAVSAADWALRSQAFVRLRQWDLGLRFIDYAIRQSRADGVTPHKDWLLSQAALEWKLGDLSGAARSLEQTIATDPEATYENTLMAFNEQVREVWEPGDSGTSPARF